MPPKAKSSPSPAPRERLTLSKLASYDDVATDALVDRVRLFPLYLRSILGIANTIYFRPTFGPIPARIDSNTFPFAASTMTTFLVLYSMILSSARTQ